MRELWLACTVQNSSTLYSSEPQMSSNGLWQCDVGHEISFRESFGLNPGQKAKLTIGEVVDCNPPKVPELWAYRFETGELRIRQSGLPGAGIPALQIKELKRGYRCRIAWDENGIRLIGTPEPI